MSVYNSLGMRRDCLAIILFVVLASLLAGRDVNAATLSVSTSGWNLSITESNLQSSTIGNDLTSTYTSASNQTILRVKNANRQNWSVYVRMAPPASMAFTLWAQVTSGSGVTPVGTYVQITSTSQLFFSGRGNVNSIRIQYQIRSISLAIDPGTYSPVVYFTI